MCSFPAVRYCRCLDTATCALTQDKFIGRLYTSEGMEDSRCPICLESLSSEGVVGWPGCEHRFHTLCALNQAQYDIRCAVCRCSLPIEKRQHSIQDLVSVILNDHRLSRQDSLAPTTTPHVVLIENASNGITEMPQENADDAVRRYRTYNARRRRFIRSRTDMQLLDERVRTEQRNLRSIGMRLQREWTSRVRQTLRRVYAEDDIILRLRHDYRLSRTRLWRHRRRLEGEVHDGIGHL